MDDSFEPHGHWLRSITGTQLVEEMVHGIQDHFTHMWQLRKDAWKKSGVSWDFWPNCLHVVPPIWWPQQNHTYTQVDFPQKNWTRQKMSDLFWPSPGSHRASILPQLQATYPVWKGGKLDSTSWLEYDEVKL